MPVCREGGEAPAVPGCDRRAPGAHAPPDVRSLLSHSAVLFVVWLAVMVNICDVYTPTVTLPATRLAAPSGQVLRIVSALWGRTTSTVCSDKGYAGTTLGNCVQVDVVDKIKVRGWGCIGSS